MSRVDALTVDHPLVPVLQRLAGEQWFGTASGLLAVVEGEVPGWALPANGQRLAQQLRASVSVLEDVGVRVVRRKSSGRRIVGLRSVRVRRPVTESPAATASVSEPVVPLVAGRRSLDRDAPAWWAVGKRTCPVCGLGVADANRLRNRRLDDPSYDGVHSYRECEGERRRLDRLFDGGGDVSSGPITGGVGTMGF